MRDAPLAWITGAGGLIGSHLAGLAGACAPGWRVLPLTRAQLDLADADAVRAFARRHPPRLILHCAALTRSPICQANPALAHRLNVEVTAWLRDLVAEGRLVLFSTDLVFDGRKGAPYDEGDPVNPLSVYGETKVAAERVVLQGGRHLVVRTSLNGGVSPTGDRGFNEELRRQWEAGRAPRLFVDEFRCPIAALVTARAVWELALGDLTGLTHVAGAERLSRYEIGQRVAARCPELRPRIEAASLKDYQGAPRPADTSLACDRAQSALSFPLPGLSGWLAAHPGEPF